MDADSCILMQAYFNISSLTPPPPKFGAWGHFDVGEFRKSGKILTLYFLAESAKL
jgi:hypothetical protein